MTGAWTGLCDHCGLPLGIGSRKGEREGRVGRFCCYGCFIGWQAAHGGGDDSAAAGFLIRLGLGAFLAMNIMLFSLLLYSGSLDGLEPGMRLYVHILLWVLATPVLLVLGGPFFAEAVGGLLEGRLPPSLLIVLGGGGAYLYSAIATVQGGDRVYFDTVAMVLVLFTLGRYLEASGRARATRSLMPMLEAERQKARIVEEGQDRPVKLADVRSGMLVRVEPWERVAVDGMVVEGVSTADEASLTGEPRPVTKTPGARMLAGSVNGEGRLLVRATAGGLDSRWIAICRDVRMALASPPRSQRLAEMAARVFIPLVVVIAAGVTWFGWRQAGPETGLMSGLAVLVVACPCALGLAAPLATSLAIAGLSRRGILIRSAAALENLAGLRMIAFDKTGTLTQGRIRLQDMATGPDEPAAILRLAAAVAAGSRHPLSRALCEEAARRGLAPPGASGVEVLPGLGVRGTVEGRDVRVGGRAWLEAEGLRLPSGLKEIAAKAAVGGRTFTLAGWDGVVRGVFLFGDAVHPDAPALVQTMKRMGLIPLVITGDGPAQAERFCGIVGVERWHAGLLPREKQEIVSRLSASQGPLAMVGDGINDAAAMTAAAVGIAVGEATDLTRETAEVVLPQDGCTLLPRLLAVARTVRRTIVTNLFWAFGYNSIAVAFAATGLLQPVIAAALMAGSSVFVVINTLFWMKPDQGAGADPFGAHDSRPSEIMDQILG